MILPAQSVRRNVSEAFDYMGRLDELYQSARADAPTDFITRIDFWRDSCGLPEQLLAALVHTCAFGATRACTSTRNGGRATGRRARRPPRATSRTRRPPSRASRCAREPRPCGRSSVGTGVVPGTAGGTPVFDGCAAGAAPTARTGHMVPVPGAGMAWDKASLYRDRPLPRYSTVTRPLLDALHPLYPETCKHRIFWVSGRVLC